MADSIAFGGWINFRRRFPLLYESYVELVRKEISAHADLMEVFGVMKQGSNIFLTQAIDIQGITASIDYQTDEITIFFPSAEKKTIFLIKWSEQ